MNDNAFGKKVWAVSAGYIPVNSNGKEPYFVSQDKLAVLNTSRENAHLKLTIYFTDGETVGTYELTVHAQRVRTFRINDLIFPHAIPLGENYGCHIESDVPVVVQFTKLYSSQANLALMGTTAYAHRENEYSDRPTKPDFTVGRVW